MGRPLLVADKHQRGLTKTVNRMIKDLKAECGNRGVAVELPSQPGKTKSPEMAVAMAAVAQIVATRILKSSGLLNLVAGGKEG